MLEPIGPNNSVHDGGCVSNFQQIFLKTLHFEITLPIERESAELQIFTIQITQNGILV